MKPSFRAAALVLGIALASAGHLQAQQDQTTPQGPHPQGHRGPRGGGNPEFEARMLTRHLSLTPEQTAQIEPILADQHQQMKALRPAPGAQATAQTGTHPDFKAMHEQTRAIMEATKAKVEAVLTPEQKEKFEKMHEHGGPHGPHGDMKHEAPAAAPSL